MYTLEEIREFCKVTGFIFQGSEIYGGLSKTWDYGPLGSLLKRNIKDAWIQKFVKESPYNVLLDSSILLNSDVWKASGHVGSFNDPLTECKECQKRYRADNLISDQKNIATDGTSNEGLFELLSEYAIMCPNCGKSNWLPVRAFNMMFQTYQGVVIDTAAPIYLRPETAQGIFINFKNIQRTTRRKIPFGVCQVGKSFRNEITPGNFIFRTREFEQMELEFFCEPGSEKEWFLYWKEQMVKFLVSLGLSENDIKLYEHPKEALSHYSNATTDIHFRYPWGFDELWGIASRTDFDLRSHMENSKNDLTYLDPETNQKYIPYVIEPSVGVERILLAVLSSGLTKEILENKEEREVLRIHPFLAPYKVAILPLSKKDLKDKSIEIYNIMAKQFDCVYDDTQSIGKRYRRQDAIGTKYCVTIDYQTLEDGTVTLRERDTMEQIRVTVADIASYIRKSLEF